MATTPVKRIALVKSPVAVAALREARPTLNTCGGYASFEGLVCDLNEGRPLAQMDYECYEALAHRELDRILDEAVSRYGICFVEVVHRVGIMAIGDVAVFIQTMAPHPREAFAAAEFVIDELKRTVPIWRRELYRDGTSEWTITRQGEPRPE